jgi:hypothetical protein
MSVKQAKTRFGEELQKLTLKKSKGDLARPRLERKGPSPLTPKLHVLIGVQEMVTASLRSDVSLTIPGRKVVVSGPVNLEKEEKAKAKGKTKEKGEDEEEEKENEPLWWSKRKTPSSLTTPNKEAPLC